MKKRLAKKAFSRSYYDLWVNPNTNKEALVPRSGRCWYIIQRACYYYGHPEWFKQITERILSELVPKDE
jgi:hypothetical protein